jgi:hypothetical protein
LKGRQPKIYAYDSGNDNVHGDPNGKHIIPIDMDEVTRIIFEMPKGGAIAKIAYTWCAFDTSEPTIAPTTKAPNNDPTFSPTIKPTRKPTVGKTGNPTLAPIPYSTACEMTRLDFNDPDPSLGLTKGAYIRNELHAKYGIKVSMDIVVTDSYLLPLFDWLTLCASFLQLYARSWDGGYRPNGQARIFDSSDPVGDSDLGSPNESCDGGGPGIGDGGAKGTEFENCEPLGNILIVQSEFKVEPDDHENGSRIDFTFDYPGMLHNITIIDNDGCNCDPVTIYLFYSDGTKEDRTGDSATGNNGVSTISIEAEYVIKFYVYFPTSGGIANIDYTLCDDPEEYGLL